MLFNITGQKDVLSMAAACLVSSSSPASFLKPKQSGSRNISPDTFTEKKRGKQLAWVFLN
jgi:hypothetical protein